MPNPSEPDYPYRLQDGTQLNRQSLATIDEEAPPLPPLIDPIEPGADQTVVSMPPSETADTKPLKKSFYQRRKTCVRISGALALVGLIVLIIGIACFHQIAQLFMNGARVDFESIRIEEPTENSFNAVIKGGISNAGPFNADTEPMNMTIRYDGQDLGWMMLPAVNLKLGSAPIEVESKFTILNRTAFVEFSKHMLADDSFTWQLVSTTNIKVMGLVSANNLIFDKKVKLQGMSNFEGVRVQNFNLEGEEIIAADIGTALLNESPISIEMGLLTMDMYYEGGYVGRVNTTLDSLKNGLNPLNLTGALTAPDSTDALAEVKFSEMFSNYIQGKDSVVTCVGVGLVSKNGSIGWLVDSIRSLNMSVILPGGQNLELIRSLTVSNMSMNFDTGDKNAYGIAAGKVQAGFKMPFDFPIEVLQSKQNIHVYSGDVHIATLNTAWTNASNTANSSIIDTYIPQSLLQVKDDQIPLFSTFLASLFVEESKSYTFVGTADLIAKTPVGTLKLLGAPLNQTITSKGMQGLNAINKIDDRTSNPVIMNTTVHKGLSDQIVMSNWITLYSPSDISVHMGDINLRLQHWGQMTGWTILRNLTVAPGDNLINVECYLQPVGDESKVNAMKVTENFLNGIPSETYMIGTADNSTKVTVLAESVQKLKLVAPFPGLPIKLVKSSTLRVNPFKVPFTKKAMSSFETVNPFLDSFTIDSISGTIYRKNNTLGEMDVRLSPQDAITVPPMSTIKTPLLPVDMKNPLSLKAIAALNKGLIHDLDVQVVTHINARLGNYSISVGYNDSSLPAIIRLTTK